MEDITPATGDVSPRHEVALKSTGNGFDLFGWFVVWILAYIPLAIPQAWWHRSFLKWLTRNVNVADGSQFSFTGEPKAIWYIFPIYWLMQMAQNPMHDEAAKSSLNGLAILFGSYLSWRVFKWFTDGLRLRKNIQFRFTGKMLHYVGWELLVTISYLTIIGWAWVMLAFFRWNCRHMESEHAELRMIGKPLQLLGIGLVCYGLPAATIFAVANLPANQSCATVFSWFTGFNLRPDVSWIHGWVIAVIAFWAVLTPWLTAWVLHWIIGNTRLMVSDTPPAAIENPTT